MARSMTITCSECGKDYHASSSVCPHCGLVGYWLGMARWFLKEALDAYQTAVRVAAEQGAIPPPPPPIPEELMPPVGPAAEPAPSPPSAHPHSP